MSIRFKTTFAFFCLSSIAVALYIRAVSSQFIHRFQELEMERVTENQSQVREAFQREIANIETKVVDWSVWDDTYRFMDDLNPEYIKSNLNTDSLVRLKIHGMIFVKDQRVLYSLVINPDTNEAATMSADLMTSATSSALLSGLTTPDSVKSNVTIVNSFPVILSARSIFTSDGMGPINGQILFVQYITPSLVQALKNTTKLAFTLTPYIPSSMTGDIGKEMKEDANGSQNDHTHVRTNTLLESDIIFRDLSNAPILYFKLKIPRTINMQGEQMVRVLVGMGWFLGISFILIILVLLDRLVLHRVESLNTDITDIGRSKDPTRRIRGVRGKDELGNLACTINGMLDSLEEISKNLQVKNLDLEASKKAMLNILEDERDLENALKQEKESIERKIAERTQELVGEKARLLASINSLNMGYLLTDTEGAILAHNDLIHTIFSLPGSALTLYSIDAKLGEAFDLIKRFRTCTVENTKIHEENVTLGSTILQIYLVPVSLNDHGGEKVIGAVILVEDVTDQRVLERSKDEFFSIASHELRTPLTAIRGNSALIQQYYKDVLKDASLVEMIDDMHSSSIRLIAIVNDFLDMSRLEMKKIEFSKKPFVVSELVKECILEFQGLENEQHVALIVDAANDLSLQALADKNKTKQILLNLISNAFKFTEKGSITISYRKDVGTNRIIISVTDTGRGISSMGQHMLFHKFEQTQDNILTRDVTRGTGLGLYISKLMAEGMGGTIWLDESVVDKGSTFSFSLPFGGE